MPWTEPLSPGNMQQIRPKLTYRPKASIEVFYTGGAVSLASTGLLACACGDDVKVNCCTICTPYALRFEMYIVLASPYQLASRSCQATCSTVMHELLTVLCLSAAACEQQHWCCGAHIDRGEPTRLPAKLSSC